MPWQKGLQVFVELVFKGLPIDRDEVEDALEDEFGADGEVTGAGVGIGGDLVGTCHLDLEIVPGLDPETALQRVHRVLAELGVQDITRINVSD